jgi:GTP-binding protein Era
MVKTAQNVFADVDVILVLVAADAALGSEDLSLFAALKSYEQRVILGINKADLIRKELLLPFIDAACQSFPFRACVPLCARTGEGVPDLLDEILALLPEGPPYFPEDMVTDRPERFFAAEIIREKILTFTHREIPYATAVVVESFREEEDKGLIGIEATINVERDSQKKILVGRQGAMLKRIGTAARLDMERFFAARIFLKLFVRVQKDWTSSKRMIREFGYDQ